MLRSLLRNFFRRDRVERDLDQELRAYTDMLADEKTQSGISRTDAEREARIELGGIEQVKEQVRASRTGAWLDQLAADLRYALRTLRRNPGFATVVVITLALGIGVNTALFSVVNALLLRDLPYKDAGRLVYVTEFWPHEAAAPGPPNFDFTNWRAHSHLVEQIEAYGGGGTVTLTTGGEAERIVGTMVTAGLLDMIGVQAALGRNFTPEEDRPGAAPAVILGYRLWQRRFGTSQEVIGKQIQMNGIQRTVVGVLPESFTFPDNNFGHELLLPMELAVGPGMREHDFRFLRVLARRHALGSAYRTGRTDPPYRIGRTSAVRDHAQGYGGPRDASARVADWQRQSGCSGASGRSGHGVVDRMPERRESSDRSRHRAAQGNGPPDRSRRRACTNYSPVAHRESAAEPARRRGGLGSGIWGVESDSILPARHSSPG
jgi:hypothetical protein